jgi:predicted esterase
MPPNIRQIAVAAVLTAAVLSHTALGNNLRTALLICQLFPQIPFKPLELTSTEPTHHVAHISSPRGPVVADLFVPNDRFGWSAPHSRPALILAMGVKTAPHDRPKLHEIGRTFARLGFVVLWPRLQVLDEGLALPEEPQTFVAGVQYVRDLEPVDPARISFLGFSTGASASLLAASSPEIAEQVRSTIFFGGYYDLSEYLFSLATATVTVDGQSRAWEPSGDVVGHVREILANEGLSSVGHAFASTRQDAAGLFRSAPPAEMEQLSRFSPALHNLGFHGRLFILHDAGDPLVPSVQSAELYRAVSAHIATTYVETSIFDHVQPRTDLTWDSVSNVVRVYGFVNDALSYL